MACEYARMPGATPVERLVSGAQTGADRAALEFALSHGLPHGGWCPKGRRAEDGRIPPRYALIETPSQDYAQRTRWNVRDSDATLIISGSPTLTGGSAYTRRCAEELAKPWLHVHPGNDDPKTIKDFLERHRVKTLNIAGPRESTEPGITEYAAAVLERLFAA
jgi:Circularly permutated YpsA SLOG family